MKNIPLYCPKCKQETLIDVQDMKITLAVSNLAKISLKFTDKVPIFIDLSVTKTHFTDKPVFYGDLSVNFWPL